MKRIVPSFAFFALSAAVAAGAAGGPVTLKPSTMTFKQSLAACPNALGSVTFTLGHSRVAAAAGVATDTDAAAAGVETVQFTGANGAMATIVANGHSRTVSGKNVTTKSNGSVACVMPD
jgi:hypothetical protein